MPSISRTFAWSLLLSSCSSRTDAVSLEQGLERRVLAPCCWRQTLEDHDSPLATTLRAEIRERIAAGEQPVVIEDDLAHRYGDKIRALPAGRDPKWMIGTVAGGASTLGLVTLVLWFRRRRSATVEAPARLAGTDERSDYDNLLDDELRDVD